MMRDTVKRDMEMRLRDARRFRVTPYRVTLHRVTPSRRMMW